MRNSIDHGIELPEIRVAAGKSAVGSLFLNASQRGGSIVIEVGDDGAGLNLERILAKARAKGLVGQNESLCEEAIANLIFQPGFSTAEVTTDLSGRGVGMDVVRRNIEELGGTIELRTESGKGSSVVITLPLTLAIVDGLSVSVGGEVYIVPLVAIVASLQFKPAWRAGWPVSERCSSSAATTFPSSGYTTPSTSSRGAGIWTGVRSWSSSATAAGSVSLSMSCSASSR